MTVSIILFQRFGKEMKTGGSLMDPPDLYIRFF